MNHTKRWPLLLLVCTIVLLSMRDSGPVPRQEAPKGAWSARLNGQDFSMLLQDGYCMFTQYSLKDKKFVVSSGGPYKVEAGKIKVKVEFNSLDTHDLGKVHEYAYTIAGTEMTTTVDQFEMKWKRVDAGDQNLAGNWRITQRKQGDQMTDIPLRARRTLKLLTATRFQWAAINIETGAFSGTGGGTYTFKDGKYTETIEFFSRDSSRVGMSLSFDGSLKEGRWIHSGKSSKGDPIYEVWERMK